MNPISDYSLPSGPIPTSYTNQLLPRSGSILTEVSDRFDEPFQQAPIPVTLNNREYLGVAQWGERNEAPELYNTAAKKNPLVSAAMEFKANLIVGDGIIPYRAIEGRKEPVFDYDPINEFLEESDLHGYLYEQALDICVLGNVFPELVLDRGRKRVIALRHREATFSRWEVADAQGEIRHHFYSSQWGPGAVLPDDTVVTQVLPRHAAARYLRYRMGLESDPTGRVKPTKATRYICQVPVPTLGRPYYARPWWGSLLESGWLEFADAIPKYKQALLANSAKIRYHVRLHPDFWRRYFDQVGAVDEAQRKAARARWLTRLDEFLSDPKNSGRAFLSERVLTGQSLEDLVSIESIKHERSGGELIADLEETSNILAYGMGVHPSLIGASPGKNKAISGSEARELFIIKQALLEPLRERILKPLSIVSKVNGWPPEIRFAIRNLQLNTLDEGSGANRILGTPAIE